MARFTPEQRKILSASLTLSAAVGIFAIAYGVLAVSAGASVLQTCALSVFTFTGASQLSAVGVIATGGSASAAIGGALMLAARNGISKRVSKPMSSACWRRASSPSWLPSQANAVLHEMVKSWKNVGLPLTDSPA